MGSGGMRGRRGLLVAEQAGLGGWLVWVGGDPAVQVWRREGRQGREGRSADPAESHADGSHDSPASLHPQTNLQERQTHRRSSQRDSHGRLGREPDEAGVVLPRSLGSGRVQPPDGGGGPAERGRGGHEGSG